MSNTNQTNDVKRALDLEIDIANNEQLLSNLLSERYKATPNPPVRKTVNKKYPPIEPKTKFKPILLLPAFGFFILDIILIANMAAGRFNASFLLKISLFLTFLWIPGYIAYVFIKKDQEKTKIKNSDEYKNKCKAIDIECERQQEEYDEAYQNAMTVYKNETIPAYNSELEAWNKEHDQKISDVKNALNDSRNELDEHYKSTQIVPLQYRQIKPLQYIYDIVSTSDYSVKEAIDLYDRNEQRKLDQAKLNEQLEANRLADQANQLAYEQNTIAEKARRDANIAAVVGTVQRHNTNKMLKKYTK